VSRTANQINSARSSRGCNKMFEYQALTSVARCVVVITVPISEDGRKYFTPVARVLLSPRCRLSCVLRCYQRRQPENGCRCRAPHGHFFVLH